MTHDELFWERVNDALDERRDPLADERVQTLVAERPERLDELLALRGRLELVATTPRPRKARRVAVAAIVLVALGTGALLLLREPRTAPAAAPLASANDGITRVLSFQITCVHENVGQRTTRVSDGERVVVRTESLAPPRVLASREPVTFVALAESVSFTR